MTIVEYLKTQAKVQRELYDNPVVAMDAIAGKSRAERLEAIATAVSGLDESTALEFLKELRKGTKICTETGSGIVFGMSEQMWFEGVVDRISRENRGWISVEGRGIGAAGRDYLPSYRRMLSLNHCVAGLHRMPDEADGVWAARRAEWLGQYHPKVRVRHARQRWVEGKMVDISLGTVAQFAAKEHTVESNLIATRGFLGSEGEEFEVVDVFMAPKGPAVATVRQIAGTARQPGLIELNHHKLELLA